MNESDRLLSCCNEDPHYNWYQKQVSCNYFQQTTLFPRLTEAEVWPMTYCLSRGGQKGHHFFTLRQRFWLLGSQFSLSKWRSHVWWPDEKQPSPSVQGGSGALICFNEGERRAGHSRSLVNQTEEKPRKRSYLRVVLSQISVPDGSSRDIREYGL